MFYLVDKPLGITSFDVLRQMRKILNIRKMGHTGTLDPLATWLLLVATGNSTKLIIELTKVAKRYRFTVQLDGKTPSLDWGTVVEKIDTSNSLLRSAEELVIFLASQTKQVPPKYSALHIGGERAYKLIQSGQEFELDERNIEVKDVEIHEYLPPEKVEISLTISSGWYIRSLAPIIGIFFWIPGGYITQLRRTDIYLNNGITLSEDTACTLENISSLPYSYIFPTIHTIDISEQRYTDLLNGKSITPDDSYGWQIWEKYFLKYDDHFLSLCQFDGEKMIIIRNHV